MGCKALAFPKQFKTQQYYDILKQVCPELERAQPGALKSDRWVYPGFGEHHEASLPPSPCIKPRGGAGIPGSNPYPTHSPCFSPSSLSPSLPDLTTVISVDEPLPGTLMLDDVVAAGSTQQHLARLQHTQQFLSCHDPVNIQFTSVGQGSPGPKPSRHAPSLCAPFPGMGSQWRSQESRHSPDTGLHPSSLLWKIAGVLVTPPLPGPPAPQCGTDSLVHEGSKFQVGRICPSFSGSKSEAQRENLSKPTWLEGDRGS